MPELVAASLARLTAKTQAAYLLAWPFTVNGLVFRLVY